MKNRQLLGVLPALVLSALAFSVITTASLPIAFMVAGRWLTLTIAVAFVSSIVGMIFGIPRYRTDFAPGASERYLSNSNLESVSDWLTKILIGATLVQAQQIPGWVAAGGRFFGDGIQVDNPQAFMSTALLLGAGSGFYVSYTWTRLRMRILLEQADRAAAEQSRIAELTQLLGGKRGDPEARRQAEDAVRTANERPRQHVLWVDDNPSNNATIVSGLKRFLGLHVEQVLDTQTALERIRAAHYDLVISDCERQEAGELNPHAGRQLLDQMKMLNAAIPLIFFTGEHGRAQKEELISNGAAGVTSRSQELMSLILSKLK